MQRFLTLEAVASARLPANIRRAVTRAVRNMLDVHGDRYDPAADGCVVLLEQSSTDDHARQLFGHPWADAPLEAVTFDPELRVFIGIALLNNQLAHTIIVPDLPWLARDFRAHLLEHLCGKDAP